MMIDGRRGNSGKIFKPTNFAVGFLNSPANPVEIVE